MKLAAAPPKGRGLTRGAAGNLWLPAAPPKGRRRVRGATVVYYSL